MKNTTREKLLTYLELFGNVNLKSYNFRDKNNFNFASIELVTTEKKEGGLEEELKKEITPERGFMAEIRTIVWGEENDGRYKYQIEIVPIGYENLTPAECEDATEHVLKMLPRILKSYRMKTKPRHKKK